MRQIPAQDPSARNQIGGISGLIVRCQPENAQAVSGRLNQLQGVEVHLVEPDGKLVVTVEERPDEKVMVDRISEINAAEGVLAAALVYAHQE